MIAESHEDKKPVVSVGIPTYQRPEGLRRTLECITRQTYPYLEIIVSDNASAGVETRSVVEEFSRLDARVKYIRQDQNIGILPNFKVVLSNASGVFFMWAADDDEWDPEFIKFCVLNIGESGSIMTSFFVKNRLNNTLTNTTLACLSGESKNPIDIQRFIGNMQPSMFYGLHRRDAVLFFLNQSAFDWMDCSVCMRLIWHSGYVTRNDVCMYVAGIDAQDYVIKPFSGRKLNPWPFLRSALPYLLRSGSVTTILRLLRIVIRRNP